MKEHSRHSKTVTGRGWVLRWMEKSLSVWCKVIRPSWPLRSKGLLAGEWTSQTLKTGNCSCQTGCLCIQQWRTILAHLTRSNAGVYLRSNSTHGRALLQRLALFSESLGTMIHCVLVHKIIGTNMDHVTYVQITKTVLYGFSHI